jgi:electron transfer flavoprotein alpha subunit
MNNNVWVILEHREGEIDTDSLFLLGEARRLLELIKGEGGISVIVFGLKPEKILEALAPYGIVDKVFYNEKIPAGYEPELYVSAINNLVGRHRPSYILLLGNSFGNDLGARLSAELQTGLVCDCVDFKTDSSGRLILTKPVYRGMLYAHWVSETNTCVIATVAQEILDPLSLSDSSHPKIFRVPLAHPMKKRISICEYRKGDFKTMDLGEAEVIVVAGRGALKGKGYDLTLQFADLFGASLACTRPLVDQGILPYERQIGQTGKTVSPRLLIACGVSGAFEFTVGIERSNQVIAINSDSKARIFTYADFGIVGDVEDVLQSLVNHFQHQKRTEAVQ